MRNHMSVEDDEDIRPPQRGIPPPPSRNMPQPDQRGQGQGGMPQRGNGEAQGVSQQRPRPQQQPNQNAYNPIRDIMAGLQNPTVWVLGSLFTLWSVASAAIVGHNDVALVTDNTILQWVLGLMWGIGLTYGEIIAITQPSKIGKDVYWILIGFDALYTARMNQPYNMMIIDKMVFAPIIIVGVMNYIGMLAVTDISRGKVIASTLTGVGIATALLLSSLSFAPPEVTYYVVLGIGLIGAYWTSRLGEEALLGKRIS